MVFIDLLISSICKGTSKPNYLPNKSDRLHLFWKKGLLVIVMGQLNVHSFLLPIYLYTRKEQDVFVIDRSR